MTVSQNKFNYAQKTTNYRYGQKCFVSGCVEKKMYSHFYMKLVRNISIISLNVLVVTSQAAKILSNREI